MVDLKEFQRSRRPAVRRQLGIFDETVLVGWVGRLDVKKNVETFIRAASIIHAQDTSIRFVIVGGPDAFMPQYAQQLKALCSELGLDQVLRFLGDRTDVPDLLTAFDVFIWLSRDEGMPHVISEAGAAGLPVIATADNGSKQQIKHGLSGYFVEYGDPEAVADAVALFANSPELRADLGRQLRKHVEDTYSVEAVIPQWEALFDEVLAERTPSGPSGLFQSFFQGGFECSTHRIRPVDGAGLGRRLDLIASTKHDQNAAKDYCQLAAHGIRTLRDGFRWHLIERSPGMYDWDSVLPLIRAAKTTGAQVIWDLLHYGWPDDIDIWSPAFVDRFSQFAGAAAKLLRVELDGTRFYSPINEISFLSWAGGDAGYLNPFATGRGFELKAQLARASIAAMNTILNADPQARFVHCDPSINVVVAPERPAERSAAEGHRLAQYQAWDMIAGRLWPQLGGGKRYLDVIGINYYHNNQWIHGGPPIDVHHPLYKPLHKILVETFARYGRPMLIAETGTEGDRRSDWLAYVGREVRAAMKLGVPLEGVCLYPITNHAGWDNDRPCENGLLSAEPGLSFRRVYQPLADQLASEVKTFEAFIQELKADLEKAWRP